MKPATTSEETTPTKIPITRPIFDEHEERLVAEVLRSGWVVQGPNVAEFERLFAEFTGMRFAIATTSCTTALHLALVTAGIGPGDEVLLPSLTFVASANAVEYVGAKPLFVDIDLNTFNINTDKLASTIQKRKDTGRLKAIMPVSLFGLCADMPTINSLAERHGLKIIEDAACGIGAFRDGHHAGSEALAACFSFHPRKAITTGEGGMMITNDAGMADQARRLRDHGAAKTDMERHLKEGGSLLPEFNEIGFNYRMTDIQGAIGVAQMAKLETILTGRREAAAYYDMILSDIPLLRTPSAPAGYQHAYQSYVCLFDPPETHDLKSGWREIARANQKRNHLMTALESEGISVRQGTHAVHTLGIYQKRYGLTDRDFPAAFAADRLSITLPLYAGMTRSDQNRVAEALKRLLESLSRS